jgi:hypothetical protein
VSLHAAAAAAAAGCQQRGISAAARSTSWNPIQLLPCSCAIHVHTQSL